MKNHIVEPKRGYNAIKGFTVKSKNGVVLFTTNHYPTARRAAALTKGAYVSYSMK